jgi:hypothetical protein
VPPSSGFGRSRFGAGPFGEADWAHNVWWLGVPAVHRDNDRDGLLETFLRSVGESFDSIRHQIRDLPSLRDPLRVRTRYDDRVLVNITAAAVTEAADSEDGKPYITLAVGSVTLPNLETVGPKWVLGASRRTYIVRSVHKVDGYFTVHGDDAPGTGLTVLRPPSLIEYLGRDFDVRIDGYEPEGFQRGLVSDVVKWYDLKGTEKGIRLRASLAGFDATVRTLWRIDPGYLGFIPAANLFEFESGVYHTDIPPGFVQFDDIPADVIPTDTLCALNPVTFSITVTAVTVVGTQFRLTVSTPLTMVANPYGPWKVTLGAAEFYVESVDTTSGYIYVAGETVPTTGAYTLEYDCRPVDLCGWCRSYKIALDLVPSHEDLVSNPTALSGAFDRLIKKINAILPAHVEVVYVLVTEGGATMEVSVSGDSETLVYGLFDADAADAHPTDTPTTTIPA